MYRRKPGGVSLRRLVLFGALLALGALPSARVGAAGPWEIEGISGEAYTPFRARPHTRELQVQPEAGPGTDVPVGPPGAAGAAGGQSDLARILSGVPKIDWLPGLPSPPGIFDSGFVPPEPALTLGDQKACLSAMADAVSYQLAGFYQAGIVVGSAAVRACPELDEARVVLAMSQLLAHQTKDAVANLEAAYEKGPRAADALTIMGLWCLFLGDNHGGRQNLEEALQKDSSAWRARLALAVQLRRQVGEAQAARMAEELARRPGPIHSLADTDLLDLNRIGYELLEAATERVDGGCVPCRRTLADVAANEAGRRRGLPSHLWWMRAIGHLERVVADAPNDRDNRLALGKALHQVGDFDRMVELYTEGLKQGDTRFVLPLGKALLDLERPDEALPHLKRATELEPDKAETWSLLGTAQRILGQKAAIASLKKALELGSDRVNDHSDLGQVLMAHGYYNEAVDAFRRSLSLNPYMRLARYGLGQALAALGRTREAEEQTELYRKVLQAYQKRIEAQEQESNRDSTTLTGLKHLEKRELEQARAAFATTLQSAKADPLAQLGMAGVALLSGAKPSTKLRERLDHFLEAAERANGFIQDREQMKESRKARDELVEAADRARREEAARQSGATPQGQTEPGAAP